MTAIEFHMTAEDMAAGVPGNGCACPAALCIMRALPLAAVCVFADRLFLDGRPVPMPPELRRFVLAFDRAGRENGSRPRPISFTLQVPDHVFVPPTPTMSPADGAEGVARVL